MTKNDWTRAEDRIEARETGKANVLGLPDVKVTCNIRDFSRSGMCITVDQDIPCGKFVKVQWADHFLIGRVQHVADVGGIFRVGLELLYCREWNELVTSILDHQRKTLCEGGQATAITGVQSDPNRYFGPS
jgi:hypothetical protein